ncbi:uncharacterized skeletal organic matrix protein 5-like [Montipora capricornis]|uniref:uncharacterized skeletal organic matrix protein 5-like n=1 Tax=Montipora capricornis TaxID=246305 RepID=UPI0035F20EFA
MFLRVICYLLLFVFFPVIREGTRANGLNTWYHPDVRQDVFVKYDSHYLNVLRVGTHTVADDFDCTFECLSHPSCLSFNLAASRGADGKLWCKLLSSDRYRDPEEFRANATSHHFSAKTQCAFSPCQNGGTCVPNVKNKIFRCDCKIGFTGYYCEIAAVSCKALFEADKQNKFNRSVLATLQLDSGLTSVLCHFGDFGCGAGAWTPVMKIDGKKQTFLYDSTFWSNKTSYNLPGGQTGFDTQETKLPTYWNTSFNKICLGMKISAAQHPNFVVINKRADSLYSLIADGQYRNVSLGLAEWKKLIGPQASLQTGCLMEGFNVLCSDTSHSKARIGVVRNNEDNCDSCDSRLGFGTGGLYDSTSSCGNNAKHGGDNGDNDMKAMGYILVQ